MLKVKQKRNVFFLEAKKIVGTYMGESIYTSVARTANTTNQNNKYRTHVRSTTQTLTIPKSVKFPRKQPLHKSLIRPPKSFKNRLKNLSTIRPEQLKQKSQAPINQAWTMQMNRERPGSTNKMSSRTISPIRIKQCIAQDQQNPYKEPVA